MTRKDYLDMIENIDHLYTISLNGTSYDVPKELEIIVLNNITYYLSPQEFWEKHSEAILGSSFEDMFGEYGDEDWDEEEIDITETYAFELKDGGEVVFDFRGTDDSNGNTEVSEKSQNADLLEDYFQSKEFSDIDKFRDDFQKGKNKKKKKKKSSSMKP